MQFLHQLYQRIRHTIRPRSKSDLENELQFHLDQSIQANIAAGMNTSEARRQALVDFGGVERAREETWCQRPGYFLETLFQDARYALRGFRRNLGFTITVIATLALGIGATTSVFSVVDRILFRALPYAHDDRLVSIGLVQSLEKQEFMFGGFFYEWRDSQRPFEAIAAQGTGSYACRLLEANPAQLNCATFQAGFLPMLGVSPVLGRNFLPEEEKPNGPHVVLISYGLWRSRYGRDPAILNRLIDVDGSPARVIGVLPEDFELPTLNAADVVFPMAMDEAAERRSAPSPGHPMRSFARLRPGISIAQARAQMEPLYLHTQQALIPSALRNDFHLSIRSLRDRQTQEVQLAAWVLLGSVLSVLVIACANVASLMMARGAARERELAVRSALGASRGRLIRQTLTEAVLISLAGAAFGLALAAGLLRIFVAMAPNSVPFLAKAHLDLRIASFTILLAIISAALFGLLPALQRPRAIATTARTKRFGKHAYLRQSLVAGQIAISMILLSGAGLLLRSLRNMEDQNLGIRTSGVLAVRIASAEFHSESVAGLVSRRGQKQMVFFAQVEAAVRRLPGIRAVAWSESLPPGGGFQNGNRFSDMAVEGKTPPTPGTGGSVRTRSVTPDYFRALQIPIIRGSNFTETERDASQRSMILSRLMASRMFPGEDPIGQRIRMGSDGTQLTVVGVAENAKNGGLVEQDIPEIYILRRNIAEDWGSPVPIMIVQTDLPLDTTATWIRSQIAHIDPTVPFSIETLNSQVSKLGDRPRFETALLSFFALTGLVMAVIGLYGVISYLAAQRTQEIGVRMALGANRSDILRLITREGFRLISLGGVIGLSAALVLTQFLRSLLFSVRPQDPATFAGVALLLLSVALLATLIPARTAMQVDPAVALRSE